MNECVRFVQVRPTVQDFTQLIHVGPTHTLNFVTLLCFVELQALKGLSGRTGAVVSALDFEQRDPWFESRPGHRSLWP